MAVTELPIFTYFNKQRFAQYGSVDCANWYGILQEDTKKVQALYPAMGRKHIEFFGQNKLVFSQEPSQIFKTIDYMYVIVGTQVIQVDKFYNERVIGTIPLGAQTWFSFLPVGTKVFGLLTAETAMYCITEDGNTVTYQQVTDANAPQNPLFVATFGDSFVVSQKNTPTYYVSAFNFVDPNTGNFNPATCFTVNGSSLTNRASSIIRQMGVLHNQLYIFCDFVTNIWANIPQQITIAGQTREFPFKLNSSYNWDYGIQDPFSLSIEFGRMCFLAKNSAGLVSYLMSNGQQPVDISSQAVNILLENSTSKNEDDLSPFITGKVEGFLYQYENTIFYRTSAGNYVDYAELDVDTSANAIEYNFATKRWGRVIELNGERNRIQKHVFFNNAHLVTVSGDGALYEMAGNIYRNELRTPGTSDTDINAFTKYPMRYELTTQQIYNPDYSEFITDYVEIDFVFGDRTFYRNNIPFDNTVFIIAENPAADGSPIYLVDENEINGQNIFLIKEEGNTPSFSDNHYYQLFKPHIELYYSDDGGVTFFSADVREFSPLGEYRWRMRWYELGTSRNRCYRLVCISSAPIVILGAVQDTRRASGGAN